MACSCCGQQLNVGMIYKRDAAGQEYKSCPRCSDTNGNEHVFHPYPAAFGFAEARVNPRNPHGDQSYCVDCRNLGKGKPSIVHLAGYVCSSLK